MPKKPDWYAQFEGIVEKLSSFHPDQPLNRVDVEKLLKVKRTEATRILNLAGGKNGLLNARTLLLYVESRREDAGHDRRRRDKLAHVVASERSMAPLRDRTFRLPKLPSIEDIPETVQFSNGVLTLRYESFEDLFTQIFLLAKAAQFDGERLLDLVARSLPAKLSEASA
jgi:hypothetical protein